MPRLELASKQSKHWCLTINNAVINFDNYYNDQSMSYLILGREVGANGTQHFQGYVVFAVRKRLSAAKKIFPRAHLEIKRGTSEQAIVYCQKDGQWREWGTRPVSVSTLVCNLWQDSYTAAIEGRIEEIPKWLLIKHYPAFKRIAQDHPIKPENLAVRDNYWIVAPSGYGKSWYARLEYPDFYDKSPNKWFVGYRGETTILCDDFSPKECEYLSYYIKRWADLFPFPMETKGGGCLIRPLHIIFTSQYSIRECFTDELVQEAVEGRFTVINLLPWQEREAIAQLIINEPAELAHMCEHKNCTGPKCTAQIFI